MPLEVKTTMASELVEMGCLVRNDEHVDSEPAVLMRGLTDSFKVTEDELRRLFDELDINADGRVSHAEFIKGLRRNPQLEAILGWTTTGLQGQESAGREEYVRRFNDMDADASKTITFSEMLEYYRPWLDSTSPSRDASQRTTHSRQGYRAPKPPVSSLSPGGRFLGDNDGTMQSPMSPGRAGAGLTAMDVEKFEKNRAREDAAPISYFYAMSYFCCADSVLLSTKLRWLGAGTFVLLVQMFVLTALCQSSSYNTCNANWQCEGRRVCGANAVTVEGTVTKGWKAEKIDAAFGPRKYCYDCGSPSIRLYLSSYLPHNVSAAGNCRLDYATFDHAAFRDTNWTQTCPLAASFVCPGNDEVCQGCYDPWTHSFTKHTIIDQMTDNLNAMAYKDWLAVTVVAVMLSLKISDNIRDICMCRIFCKRHIIDVKLCHGAVGTTDLIFHTCLEILAVFRRYVKLPLSIFSLSMVILLRGGDALSVCLNAVVSI